MTNPKKKPKFSLTTEVDALRRIIGQTDHQTLAVWANDCAERVLPYYEEAYPDDPRPRRALETLQAWIDTGEFHMAVIRKASLDAHAAAREVGEDNPARSAARAAGQAVATAHARGHAPGAAIYALQAIYRSSSPEEVETILAAERAWQRGWLVELRDKKPS